MNHSTNRNHSNNNNNNTTNTHEFWIKNPSTLFQCDTFYKVFPSDTLEETLNNLTRAFIYMGIIFSIILCSLIYIFIALVGIILIIIYYMWYSKEAFKNFPIENNFIANNSRSGYKSDKLNKNYSTRNKSLGENKNIHNDTNTNDQSGFAHWLYEPAETCKENHLKCIKYEDPRFNK